jgi:hypothetical protein
MATADIKITKAWGKIADAGQSLLLTFDNAAKVRFATVATDADPTVRGHTLVPTLRDGLTRTTSAANCPPGFVFARIDPDEGAIEVEASLDVWTE